MSGQLKTWEEAMPRKTQHTSPCSDCPFARTALRGWLGRASVEEWLIVAHGEGIIECHTSDKLCAGAAIFRANVCKVLRDPKAFRLPSNTTICFASDEEFQQHHTTIKVRRELRIACRLSEKCSFMSEGETMSMMKAEIMEHAAREHGFPWPDAGIAILPSDDCSVFEAKSFRPQRRSARGGNGERRAGVACPGDDRPLPVKAVI